MQLETGVFIKMLRAQLEIHHLKNSTVFWFAMYKGFDTVNL